MNTLLDVYDSNYQETMFNPLPFLDLEDFVVLPKMEPLPPVIPEQLPPAKVALPPPPPYECRRPGDFQSHYYQQDFQRVEGYLGTAEVEQYLHEVEDGRGLTNADTKLEQPPSPFFGRTTPLLYDANPCSATEYPDFKQLVPDAMSPAPSVTSVIPETLQESVGADPTPLAPLGDGQIDAVPMAQGGGSTVKDELREKIQSKRRASGLGEAVTEWKDEEPETLTERDIERRERRRASNRRAAAKSRVKKRAENGEFLQKVEGLEENNSKLATEVSKLKKELEEVRSSIRDHTKTCPNPDHLWAIINS